MGKSIVKDVESIVKNPIGVIGMFLVLVEAIAALVVVNSVLSDWLNLILVLFISLFPFVVLWVFYLLVTKHHSKLYSPSDYKDETNFVRTYNSSTMTEEYISESKLECQKRLASVPLQEDGLSQSDVELIKETLNSIVSMQKQLSMQMHNDSTVQIVEKTEQEINSRIDNYLIQKQDVHKDKYTVEISPIRKSHRLAQMLSERGYNARIYTMAAQSSDFTSDYESHEAIWLGYNIPLDMVIEVIGTAKSVFPHLKYIQLSDETEDVPMYVHNQIYIGGATSTAINRRLKVLSSNDFNKLLSLDNLHDLHEFVLSFE